MVGSIGSTNNLINMVSLAYQQSGGTTAEQGGRVAPAPPPPPDHVSDGGGKDKLGMFDTADSDSSGGISEEEYATLTQGILEVSGTEVSDSFADYDLDEDGVLNGAELKSVLDESGFTPPPPPPRQVSEAYEAQSGNSAAISGDTDPELLAQLLAYLETGTGDDDLDIIA